MRDRRTIAASIVAFALGGLLLCGNAVAATPIVAVFNIENQGSRLSRRMIDRLTSYLATKLASGGYKVVPREQIKRRLARQKRRSYRRCYAQSCQIEIGKELAASKSLASQLMRIGRRCVLTVTLYDLRSAATERAATAKGRCSEEAVIGLIDRAVSQLTGGESSAPVASGSAAPAVKAPAGPKVIGPMSREQIRAVIKRNIKRVTACYERALVKDPNLAGGRVVLDFTIGATGAVISTAVSHSTLNHRGVERCVEAVFRKVRFPRPLGGGIVKVRYPFVFRTAGTPPSTPVERPAPPDRPAGSPLSRSQIQSRMRQWKGAVQKCYDRHKKAGLAKVQMVIENHGMVSRARVTGRFAGTPTGRCIEAVIRRVIFPPFGGGPLTITYPFVLR